MASVTEYYKALQALHDDITADSATSNNKEYYKNTTKINTTKHFKHYVVTKRNTSKHFKHYMMTSLLTNMKIMIHRVPVKNVLLTLLTNVKYMI